MKKILLVVAVACVAQPALGQKSWISPLDYPSQLLEQGKEGRVRVELVFAPEGRVTSCTILQSSGTALLDATTCRLLHRRARAQAGAPRVQTIEHDWKVPDRSYYGSAVRR